MLRAAGSGKYGTFCTSAVFVPEKAKRSVEARGDRVRFSVPGLPTVMRTDDWIDLEPGNGLAIDGCTAWRDGVVVTKPGSRYVFYGVTTDHLGGSIFNYRVERVPARTPRALLAEVLLRCCRRLDPVRFARIREDVR